MYSPFYISVQEFEGSPSSPGDVKCSLKGLNIVLYLVVNARATWQHV